MIFKLLTKGRVGMAWSLTPLLAHVLLIIMMITTAATTLLLMITSCHRERTSLDVALGVATHKVNKRPKRPLEHDDESKQKPNPRGALSNCSSSPLPCLRVADERQRRVFILPSRLDDATEHFVNDLLSQSAAWSALIFCLPSGRTLEPVSL